MPLQPTSRHFNGHPHWEVIAVTLQLTDNIKCSLFFSAKEESLMRVKTYLLVFVY